MNCKARRVSPRRPMSRPESSPSMSNSMVSSSPSICGLGVAVADTFIDLSRVSTVIFATAGKLDGRDVSVTLMRAGSAPNPSMPPLPWLITSTST